MQCTVCTFLNDSRLLECEVCQSSLNTSIIQGDIDICNPIHPAKRARPDVVSRSTVPDAEPSFDSGAATQGIIPTLRNVLDRKRSKYAVCSPCPHITQSNVNFLYALFTSNVSHAFSLRTTLFISYQPTFLTTFLSIYKRV